MTPNHLRSFTAGMRTTLEIALESGLDRRQILNLLESAANAWAEEAKALPEEFEKDIEGLHYAWWNWMTLMVMATRDYNPPPTNTVPEDTKCG